MKLRIRAILIALLGVVGLSLVNGGSAEALGGCVPHFDRTTGEIYMVC